MTPDDDDHALLMESASVLRELKGYVGFSDADADALRAAGPALAPSFPTIVDAFYEVIEVTPGALSVFAEGLPQIERQKLRLLAWLEGLFGGTYGEAYLERRARIGRVHVRIGLAQRYMFGAMNVIRRGLHEALDAAEELEDRNVTRRAIDRILDLELAIMLESYRDQYVVRQRSQERLATLGQVAASIGHELRNPLAVMSTSLHLLRRSIPDDERALRRVDKVSQQVELSSRIIGDLLALTREGPSSRRPTDLALLLGEAIAAASLPDEVQLRLEVDELPSLFVDDGQLRQALVNLLVNAAQAMPEGGEVLVRAHLEEDTLHIEVLDEGPGFAQSVRASVFEPLVTTKNNGFGLGLALCKHVVEGHSGTIEIGDRPGGGARVALVVPGVLPTK